MGGDKVKNQHILIISTVAISLFPKGSYFFLKYSMKVNYLVLADAASWFAERPRFTGSPQVSQSEKPIMLLSQNTQKKHPDNTHKL